MNLSGQIVQVVELSANDRCSMFELMRRHYVNVDRATFDADLNDKQWVIELRAPNANELVGFSTQTLMERSVDGRSVRETRQLVGQRWPRKHAIKVRPPRANRSG